MNKILALWICLSALFISYVSYAQTTPTVTTRSGSSNQQSDDYLIGLKRLGIPTSATDNLDADFTPENTRKLLFNTTLNKLRIYNPATSTWADAASTDIASIVGLQAALDGKANLAGGNTFTSSNQFENGISLGTYVDNLNSGKIDFWDDGQALKVTLTTGGINTNGIIYKLPNQSSSGDYYLATTNDLTSKANDNSVVKLTGTQTILGSKMLTGLTSIDNALRVTSWEGDEPQYGSDGIMVRDDFRRTKLVANGLLAQELDSFDEETWTRVNIQVNPDGNTYQPVIPAKNGFLAMDNEVVKLTSNQNVNGIKTHTSVIKGIMPVANEDLTTKQYVDYAITNANIGGGGTLQQITDNGNMTSNPIKIAVGAGGVNGVMGLTIGSTSNYPSLELGIENSHDAQIRTYGNNLHLYAGHFRNVGDVATESHQLNFYTSKNGSANWSTPKMTLNEDGNIGIGITNPLEKLVVNGKIRAKEVKVEPINGWPDYVFAENYKKLSLSETEVFIRKYKHLPEVPSANEVSANGLELGEMSKVLLKKVEELTLHMIEKEKQLNSERELNKQQGEQINSLRQQYQELRALIGKTSN